MKAIVFSSKPDNVTEVEKFIEGLRTEVSISDDRYDDIFLALIEAGTNAMRHGNKWDEHKNVELTYKLDEGGKTLIVTVKDEGPGFDYTHVPDPTAPENLEKAGGRGVYLMRQLAQAIIYTDNGATVEMHFSI
jgi:anti-sigma regulatory factor (Ser/Thr protein kinase)